MVLLFSTKEDWHRSEFDLGRSYQTFNALVGITDDSASADKMRFSISNENDTVLREGIVALGETQPVSIDVSNVLRLKIYVERLSSEADAGMTMAFIDGTLE